MSKFYDDCNECELKSNSVLLCDQHIHRKNEIGGRSKSVDSFGETEQ